MFNLSLDDVAYIGRAPHFGKYFLSYDNNSFKVVHLSLFQRIFRLLGFYKSTHLATVHDPLKKEFDRMVSFKKILFRWVTRSSFDFTNTPLYQAMAKIDYEYFRLDRVKSALPHTLTLTHHISNNWRRRFQAETKKEESRRMLANIFSQTMRSIKDGYISETNRVHVLKKEDLEKMKTNQKRFKNIPPLPITTARKTEIKVLYEDCLDHALYLKRNGYNPAVLNMASDHNPGGGVTWGSSAQEESICRRTTYMQALDPRNNPSWYHHIPIISWVFGYKVPEFGVIYTPGVQILREGPEHGFKFKDQVETIDMIAAAAYDLNKVNPNNYEENTKEKIRQILRSAKITGHDSVVLSALGCGAYGNDPKIVSRLFQEVLLEPEFRGMFKRISFAIIDSQNSKNYSPFRWKLNNL